MPIQVQGPDGQLLEFPDGTDRETMRAAMQKRYGGPKDGNATALDKYARAAGLPANADPRARYASMSMEDRYAAQGIDPNEYGGTEAERARKAYDDSPWWQRPMIAAGAEFTNAGRSIGRLVTPNDSQFNRELAASADAERSMQSGVHGVSGFVGRALPYLATAPLGGPEAAILGRVPQAGRLATAAIKAGTAAAEGAGYGALTGGAESDSDRLANAGFGALGGLAGRGIVGGAKGALSGLAREADPILRANIEAAQKAGIPLHLSQVAQSVPAKAAASMAKYLPFSGAGKAARNQQNAWNRALTREAGDATDRLDDAWVAKRKQELGDAYDDIWSRNDVTITPQGAARMSQVVKDAYRDLGTEGGKIVENQFNRIMDDILRAGHGGKITGRNYQTLASDLAGVQPGTSVGNLVGRLRKELIGEADNSISQADAQLLKDTNRKYNNFKTLEKLLTRIGGAKADISPASLWAAVNARGPKATKELRELAKVGQSLLKEQIPDSGTAGRLFSLGLLGGGGVPLGGPLGALGTIAGGATVGRLLNSPLAGAAIARGAGKSNMAQNILDAAGVKGAIRRGAGRGVQRGVTAGSAASQRPLEIDIVGGTPVSAEEYARLRARESGR